MQQHSQNWAEYALPSFYCDDIFVLLIILYCITTATVSCLICSVTGITSHMTHCAAWLLSQSACSYSLLISHSTSLLMHTYFTYRWPCHAVHGGITHDACACHSIIYLITVLTIWKTSRSFPLSSKLKALSENLNKLLLLQLTHLVLCTLLVALHSSPCMLQSTLCSFLTLFM